MGDYTSELVRDYRAYMEAVGRAPIDESLKRSLIESAEAAISGLYEIGERLELTRQDIEAATYRMNTTKGILDGMKR
ncbi:MAG: hypothetical protein HY518_05295 [Candidatus Aenigmarchaeota archaeon]|nr:hypothetical protein [Candidatus Aenigmarchaeota archaeon]